ncbi:13103_t:CDS:2 [Funneliformis mosseae]|uniref:13103_t:CDS:1 n=1 Tax=Funneliformis mosseae TaxID=27381 RepID=A0A9N8YZW7_FUNMO|nr:13103_t:CDS:2 [Funneliformis mosseae]
MKNSWDLNGCVQEIVKARLVRDDKDKVQFVKEIRDSCGEIVRGKISTKTHGCYLYVPKGIKATGYHSLAGHPNTEPYELETTSWTESGDLMGVRHREFTIEGVQFHSESIKFLKASRW